MLIEIWKYSLSEHTEPINDERKYYRYDSENVDAAAETIPTLSFATLLMKKQVLNQYFAYSAQNRSLFLSVQSSLVESNKETDDSRHFLLVKEKMDLERKPTAIALNNLSDW